MEPSRQTGFTLIELMIVVAIIGILAAIAIPQFASYRAKAFNASAQADLRNAMTAEEAYFSNYQEYFANVTVANPNGWRGQRRGITVSKNVAMTIVLTTTNGFKDYAGTTRHTQGNYTYAVTGSVGVIR